MSTSRRVEWVTGSMWLRADAFRPFVLLIAESMLNILRMTVISYHPAAPPYCPARPCHPARRQQLAPLDLKRHFCFIERFGSSLLVLPSGGLHSAAWRGVAGESRIARARGIDEQNRPCSCIPTESCHRHVTLHPHLAGSRDDGDALLPTAILLVSTHRSSRSPGACRSASAGAPASSPAGRPR